MCSKMQLIVAANAAVEVGGVIVARERCIDATRGAMPALEVAALRILPGCSASTRTSFM